VLPKWAWSGSREQFLHCGLRKFRHSKSWVYRWYPQLVRGRFVYDTSETMKATQSRHGWEHMFIIHCLQLNLQLHTIDLVRSCRTSSFCTVAWQLARFKLTRRITRSLGDSWASCLKSVNSWRSYKQNASFASEFRPQRCRTRQISKITCVWRTETGTDSTCYVNRQINVSLLSTNIKLL